MYLNNPSVTNSNNGIIASESLTCSPRSVCLAVALVLRGRQIRVRVDPA